MRRSQLALALGLALGSACGAARVVGRTPDGGVLVLEGIRDVAQDDAHRKMTASCHGPYTIMRDGDEVAGQATEFRVHYVCGKIPGMPSSQYERPPITLEGIPDATSISLH